MLRMGYPVRSKSPKWTDLEASAKRGCEECQFFLELFTHYKELFTHYNLSPEDPHEETIVLEADVSKNAYKVLASLHYGGASRYLDFNIYKIDGELLHS